MSSDWTFLRDETPRAKKAYKCYLCNLPIAIGDKHVARVGVSDDRVYTTRMHEKCVALTKGWNEDDWMYFEPKEFRRHELGLPDDMKYKFERRTREHIHRVINNARRIEERFPGRFHKLWQQALRHDQSKFKEPELEPYIWLTEYYRCKNEGIPFQYPEGMEKRVNEATIHHVRNNTHHPEFYDPKKNEIKLGKDREELTKISDATLMPDTDIAEMICDWAAMSQELGTSLRSWVDKQVNERWKFTPKQVNLIYELSEAFETLESKLDGHSENQNATAS